MNELVKELSRKLSEARMSHLIFVFNPDGHSEYYGLMEDDEVCEIIERLAKDYGGEVIDRVVDKLIQEGEWPETIR